MCRDVTSQRLVCLRADTLYIAPASYTGFRSEASVWPARQPGQYPVPLCSLGHQRLLSQRHPSCRSRKRIGQQLPDTVPPTPKIWGRRCAFGWSETGQRSGADLMPAVVRRRPRRHPRSLGMAYELLLSVTAVWWALPRCAYSLCADPHRQARLRRTPVVMPSLK